MPLVRNALIKRMSYNRILLRHLDAIHKLTPSGTSSSPIICRCKSDKPSLSSLVVPIKVKLSKNPDDINIGAEITGAVLKREEVIATLNRLLRRQPIRQLAVTYGIDNTLFQQCFQSFRTFCLDSKVLPPELHIKLVDIIQGNGNVDDLFPDFLKHSREIFPHLECLEELKSISDLSSPVNWYTEARNIERKIIFHSGPTNSGKTYHAMKRFIEAQSGIYCAPLKLLAVEVKNKTNAAGTKCDLVTGEERFLANEDGSESQHVSCTVEMACTKTPRDVAIIDEIQMIRDGQRGWAWTRALLGIPAKEIHLCGEEAALDLIRELLSPIGEDVEVQRYERLTPLVVQDKPLASLENVEKGDCIVCFSKKDIFAVSHQLEKLGHDVAVIYGSLPPGTKVLQTKKFNDPNDPCNILVATDAIGMGLNLSIKRVIFYSTKKPVNNEKGEVEVETIPTSQALQIAGRAGRFNTEYSTGYVTTFSGEDLKVLKDVLAKTVDPIGAAGLHPTMEQIEMFAFHLPNATFSNLFDIFISICKMDTSCYFMCNVDNIKYLADLIQHVPLPLRVRYVFCHAPINMNVPFISTMFLKFARQYSQNEPITIDWMFRTMQWPFKAPRSIAELVHLEAAFDVLDLYLWLGYRFPDLFPDSHLIREMQRELDELIHTGVNIITKSLRPESLAAVSETNTVPPKKTEKTRPVVEVDVENDAEILKEMENLNDLTRTLQNVKGSRIAKHLQKAAIVPPENSDAVHVAKEFDSKEVEDWDKDIDDYRSLNEITKRITTPRTLKPMKATKTKSKRKTETSDSNEVTEQNSGNDQLQDSGIVSPDVLKSSNTNGTVKAEKEVKQETENWWENNSNLKEETSEICTNDRLVNSDIVTPQALKNMKPDVEFEVEVEHENAFNNDVDTRHVQTYRKAGPITKKLISSGIVTPKTLELLKKELGVLVKNNINIDTAKKPGKKEKPPRKRK